MLWEAELITKFDITVKKIIDALTKILNEIFGFIAEEEGWEEETE